MSEVIIPETLQAKAKELALPQSLAAELLTRYAPHASACAEIRKSADEASEIGPAKARELRLAMVKVRTGSDKTRKELKADSLLRGRAIDGIHAMIEMEAVALERRMDEIEKAEERARAAKVAALRAERLALLRPLVDGADALNVESLDEASWQSLLESSRLAAEARKRAAAEAAEEAAKAADERRRAEAEAERARQAELAAAREEAAKAKAVRDEAERAAAAEREASKAAKARAEAAERCMAELTARAEQAARDAAVRSAARETVSLLASDAEKVLAYANAIAAIPVPALGLKHTAERTLIGEQAAKFCAWLRNIAAKIEG